MPSQMDASFDDARHLIISTPRKLERPGRCKFPLLNGKVLEDTSIDDTEEDKEVIAWCVTMEPPPAFSHGNDGWGGAAIIP